MASEFDLIIRNGTVIDGSGGQPFESDIAVRDGRIAEVGRIAARGREEIDAKGLVVTPGFVDIHTHYDGQAVWSDRLAPSSSHGVTSVVMGNCGVGFAPCRAGDRGLLISVMEGVEDIPEVVMTDGLTWDWETFPQYLDALERRPHDIDFATQIPHSAIRVFAMGARAPTEIATDEDKAKMQALVREALDAGALGFATSRLFIHRTGKGAFIPSYAAEEAELGAMAQTLKEAGRGVLQFVLGRPGTRFIDDVRMVARLAKESGRPASFSFAQDNSNADAWREILDVVAKANASGSRIRAQIFPRPVGMMIGYELSVNPFCLCPSYQPLLALPFPERIKALRDPSLRARLLSEKPLDPVAPLALLGRNFERMFPLGDPPNYEPPMQTSIAAQARAQQGLTPEELAYDTLLEEGGKKQLYVALTNYARGNLDAVLEMMRRDDTVLGLGDGGAHYGMICDSGYPTFLLAHWTRDRHGDKLPLPQAIRMLTRDPAETVGLNDRGRIGRGYKADLNILDYDSLELPAPTVAYDLPAGGKRLMQGAKGIKTTIVSGVAIARDGEATGARPGKLVRGAQGAPK
ncbi:MAG TPA: amidohydrolase family protein [Reyranella sp.]|nr:amidohydrolase family protein [Reyranella sp.]